jgi:hypothetical protein
MDKELTSTVRIFQMRHRPDVSISQIKPHLFNDGGELRPFVNLFMKTISRIGRGGYADQGWRQAVDPSIADDKMLPIFHVKILRFPIC